jgi:hypothetical protein
MAERAASHRVESLDVSGPRAVPAIQYQKWHLRAVLTASPNSRLIPASRGAGIDPVPFAGIAANNLEIALFRELRTLNRR